MGDWSLRVRAVVGDNLWLIASGFAVLLLLGAFVTYGTYVDPGEAIETREVAQWSDRGAFSHEATVREGTDVFEQGTVLRDRNVYFAGVAPVLNGTVTYSYNATDGGDLRAEGTTTLVLRSVSETSDGNVTEYWHLEERLGTTTEESLGPGERVSVPFEVNVSAVTQRVDTIEEQLGGTSGEMDVVVRSRFELRGTRNGQSIDETQTYEAAVETDGNVYSVEGDEPSTDSDRQVEEVSVPATYGPVRNVGGPLLLLVGIAGLAGLVATRRRGTATPSDVEREWLAYRSAREEFDDWITVGRVPDEALAGVCVPVDMLEGLVDIAIDCDRRVIEDQTRGTCIVSVDDLVYTYDVPDEPGVADRQDPLVASSGGDGTSANDESDGGSADLLAQTSSGRSDQDDAPVE